MLVRRALLPLAAVAAAAMPSAAHAAPPTLPNPWPALGVTCASQRLAGSPYVVGVNCRHLLQFRYPRRYVVWVPASAARDMAFGRPAPLVVMLHGSSGTGEQFLKMSGWREKAEAEGLVVAFPTGLTYLVTERARPRHSTKWASFDLLGQIDPTDRPRGYPTAPVPFPADDVGFVRSLVADVQSGLRIDRDRTYVAGFSNGGEMCARLAVEASDVFAAASCNAGGLNQVHPTTPGRPNMPVLFALGSRDDRVVTKMQDDDPTATEVPLDPAALAATPVLSTFVRSGLGSLGLSDADPSVVTSAIHTQLRWQTPLPGNADGNTMLFTVLAGVTHQYPNGRNNPAGFVMADHAWDFFRSHPRP